MGRDIKIFISYHKKCFVPKQKYLYPIQVGAQNAKERFPNMLHDDEGENISEKNPMYCELTAQYWAWKNMDAEYYGFFHYRRFMSFSKKTMHHNQFQDAEIDFLNKGTLEQLELDNIGEIVPQYDIITTTPVVLKELNPILHSNAEQYSLTPYQYQEDLDVMLDIIKEKYPEYYVDAYNYLYKCKYGFFCNMFIMRKDIFQKYSSWLFDILEEHERRRNYSQYSIDAYRISGYLGERLFGIYYLHLLNEKKYKTCELQRTLFKNVDIPEVLKPAYEKNNIPIAIATNNYYAPYISTLLMSIVNNSSSNNNYDILILTHDTSNENKNILKQYADNNKNVSIRFADPGMYISEYKLYTRGHFSIETYYRLVLPEMLKSYDKLIYVDVDMIVQEDLANLYNINVDGYLLAAANDPDTAGLYNGYQPDKKEYMDTEMQLENPYNYFQAGTLLLNLKEFRKNFTTEQILEVATSKEWQLLDQDILNKICEGKVKYLDMSWNVMYDYAGVRLSQVVRLAPRWLYDMYVEARKHPKIIHYAGPEKPWLCPECDFASEFWKYARKTEYYEIMLYRMSHYAANKEFEMKQIQINNRNKAKSPIYRTIRCLFLYGPRHTMSEIRNELHKK